MMKKITNLLHNLLEGMEDPILFKAKAGNIHSGFVKDLLLVKNKLKFKPETIIDIGASVGRWSEAAHLIFPNAVIYAFEPLPESFAKLKRLGEKIKNIKTFNTALSDVDCQKDFYHNEFSDSSSLLKITDKHKKEFPHAKSEREMLKVNCRRLDSLNEVNILRPCMVKIDVQGAEHLVIHGIGALIDRVDVLIVEYNFENFYSGQATLNDILLNLQKYFGYFVQKNLVFSDKDNRLLFCDFIFMKIKDEKK